MTENFSDKFEITKSLVNDELDKLIKKPYKINKTNLYEAMGYSLLSNGKRIRALLLLSVYNNYSQDLANAMPFACALEMIHAYSLIHDDLPALDNDDFRRGVPTNHKVYGEAIAILAGDGLLNLAYETMIKQCIKSEDNTNPLRALQNIAHAAGPNGMISGQTMDIISENKIINKETLTYIHKNKTGALLKSSIVSGAILSNEPNEKIIVYEQIGDLLGLSFQIKDDILEFTSDSEVLGKDVSSDQKNNKSTYVNVFGIEAAKLHFEMYSNEALELTKNLENPFLQYIAKTLVKRKY